MRAVLIAALIAAGPIVSAAAPGQYSGGHDRADRWSRLTSANFELYTDAGQKDGHDLLRRFEEVRSFFLKAAPVRAPEEFPVRIIAFRSRDEFRTYAPSQNAAAFYTSNAYRDYIVLSGSSQEAFSAGVHEYTHLAVRHSGLRLPLWINEGWADVFSSMRHVTGGVAVGDLLKDRVPLLENGEWMGLDELTRVTQDSPEYHEPNRVGMFYSESWVLTHMLYLSPEYKNNFPAFLNAIHRGVPFAQAAESSFGKSEADIYRDLRAYLGRKKMTGQIFEVELNEPAGKPQIVTIPDFDSRLMLADLRAATGEFARAREEYDVLNKEQPNRPELALSLGYLALARKDKPAAIKEFAKAFASGFGDARMCFQLAILEREDKVPAVEVIPVLERAVMLRPNFTDAIVNLGLLRLEIRDYERTIELLTKVDTVVPSAAPAVFTALAYANLQTGHLEEAAGAAVTARKYAKTSSQINAVTAIEGLIEARKKGRFPPRPGEKLQQVNGMVLEMKWDGANGKLRVSVAGQPMLFELPDPRAVEFTRRQGSTAQLTCSVQQPFPVVVEFASPNIVRRLEF